jgi:hydroxymethylglutaryl-CoA lyase
VGFDTVDFGSFVSPKTIPQMKDTALVLDQLELDRTSSKLLAIVANERGAMDAVEFAEISCLGFPFSVSETFQQRNTNKSISEALNSVSEIQELCKKHEKTLVTYISMGFGNPYQDPYDVNIVSQFVGILATLEIEVISLADTIGVSKPDQITFLFSQLKSQFPKIEFGAHLHSTPWTAIEKIEAAFNAGCNRFDGALKGWGGCPMAEDGLVGNLATETILNYLKSKNENPNLNETELAKALAMTDQLFNSAIND